MPPYPLRRSTDARSDPADRHAAPPRPAAAGGRSPAHAPPVAAGIGAETRSPSQAVALRRRAASRRCVLAAFLGWYLAVGRYTATPSVVGLSKAAPGDQRARQGGPQRAVLPSGLQRRASTRASSPRSTPGQARPAQGRHSHAAPVAGPERTHVPNVRNKTVDDATAAVERAQLTMRAAPRTCTTTRSTRASSSGPTPRRARSQPAHRRDARRQPGSAADHHAGRDDEAGGPGDVDPAGARAQSETTKANFSDKVPEDTVIASTPAAGFDAHKGDTVTLVVSKGPQLYPVPDVRGMKVDDAVKKHSGRRVQGQRRPVPGRPGPGVPQSPGPQDGSSRRRDDRARTTTTRSSLRTTCARM